ncbi:hypothetical protein B0I35DRAFT_415535 [Stachybotrys elegans]|uniref:Uncharacterized protein n=1 Tax=Stachybotrys elegans TaxID=80388 RepID=A0A8K0S9W6_9HYPO|nr:hypothetical protein B0I35DRAFT_415535 [Stachybotrys elegans]
MSHIAPTEATYPHSMWLRRHRDLIGAPTPVRIELHPPVGANTDCYVIIRAAGRGQDRSRRRRLLSGLPAKVRIRGAGRGHSQGCWQRSGLQPPAKVIIRAASEAAAILTSAGRPDYNLC